MNDSELRWFEWPSWNGELLVFVGLSRIGLGLIFPAEEYCVQNDDLNDVIVISIRGEKKSSQNISEKAQTNKNLELDYSLYLESMYVILYLGSWAL